MTVRTGVRDRQRERSRERLIVEARRLFRERGFAGVTLDDVVVSCGLTKGALYHHFAGKRALFLAVLERVHDEVSGMVAAAAAVESQPWEQFVAGCEMFLAACAQVDPRINLVDAPAVIGWSEWRALDDATSGRHLAEAVEALIDAGELAPQPGDALVRLVSGAMNDAALWIGEAPDSARLADATTALADLLAGLRRTGDG